MGTHLPLPKGAQPPQFSAHICCIQVAAWIKMSLGMELGLGRGDFVLDGDPAPPPPKGAEPPTKFSAHVYCGQTAGWMKLVLGMQVGLRNDLAWVGFKTKTALSEGNRTETEMLVLTGVQVNFEAANPAAAAALQCRW